MPEQPDTTGTECGAHRHLLPPACGACQQQIGHVHARNEQHQRHGADEHQQRRFHVTDELIAQRHQQDAFVLVRLWVLLRKCGGDGGDLGLRRCDADPWLQPSDGFANVRHARLPQLRRQYPRHEDLVVTDRPARHTQHRPEHADDLVGFLVEHDRSSDDGRVGSEGLLPQPVTEDHCVPPRLLIVHCEDATEQRVQSHGAERLAEHAAPVGPDRFTTCRGDRAAEWTKGAHLLERRRSCAPVEEVRRRDIALDRALVRLVLEEHHDARFIAERQRPHECVVGDGIERHRDADPEGEGQDGESREARVADHQPEPELDIGQECRHQGIPLCRGGIPPVRTALARAVHDRVGDSSEQIANVTEWAVLTGLAQPGLEGEGQLGAESAPERRRIAAEQERVERAEHLHALDLSSFRARAVSSWRTSRSDSTLATWRPVRVIV